MAFISSSSYIDHLPPQTSEKKKTPPENKQSILFFLLKEKTLKTTLKHPLRRRKTHNYRHRQQAST
jgi:hypothetical protein